MRSEPLRPANPERLWYLVLPWVLMLPIIFFAVHGSFSFQNAGNNNVAGGSSLAELVPGRSLGLVGYVVIPGIAYGIVSWLIFVRGRDVLAEASRMKLLTALALLTVVSAIWSQSPMRSAYNGLFYLVDTLFAYYLVVRFDPDELMTLFTMGCVTISLLDFVLIVFYPQYGIVHITRSAGAWQGIFLDRTSYAKCLVFLLSPALVLSRRSLNPFRLLYVLVIVSCILKAKAATPIIVLVAYVAITGAVYLAGRLDRRTMVLAAAIGIPLAGVFAYVLVSYLPALFSLLGRDSTLSGRTDVWTAVIHSIVKRPLLGYGYYAFWLGLKGESANAILSTHWVFGYAHNGILEIFLQLGTTGVVLFFATLIQALRNAAICLRHNRPLGVDWYLGIILLTVFYNIDEASVVWPNELLSILYVVACCGLAKAAAQFKSTSVTIREKTYAYGLSPA
jgi:O-antigen ligase